MVSEWSYLLNFLEYLAVTIPLLALGIFFFTITTPYKEYDLIKEGSQTDDKKKVAAAKAAANDLGGKIIGLAIVLASAIYHAVGLWDLVIWGIIGMVFQVLVFYLFEWLTPFKMTAEIPNGNVSVGIFSSRLSVAAGLILAALISY